MPVAKIQSSFFARGFPAPRFLTLDPVGLDISPGAVRIMQLVKTNAGFVPHIYDEVILTAPCVFLEQESDLQNCDELRAALIKLRDTYKLHHVAVSLPELKTYIFKTTLPREAQRTIEETLRFKLEENVPLPPQDVVFQYSVLNESRATRNGDIEVVVSALPKAVVDMYTKLLRSIDLAPISFESESQSLARSLVPKNDPGAYLLVHFGITKISLAIVEHNVVQYTSSLPVPSQEITADLAGTAAQTLKEQINKLLIYWFTNRNDPESGHKIEIAIIAGAPAMIPGLVDFLERGLRLSVKLGNVWQNAFSIDAHVPPISYEKSLDYATAIGLTLLYKE